MTRTIIVESFFTHTVIDVARQSIMSVRGVCGGSSGPVIVPREKRCCPVWHPVRSTHRDRTSSELAVREMVVARTSSSNTKITATFSVID